MTISDYRGPAGRGRPERCAGLDPELAEWVEAHFGREVASCRRAATGGSRTTWLVDLSGDDSPRSVVVRVEGQGSFTGTEVSLAREMVVFEALSVTDVPVPRVFAIRDDGGAAILERLPGTDELGQFSDAERASIMDHFAAVLANMHRVDADSLDLPGFERPSSPEDHARLDLGMWQRLASTIADLDPLIAYCGSWLVAHAPTSVAKTAFVQGDTGPGNFMADAGRVSGLVDMEFAHIGDPMDDIAWVMMRLRDTAAPEDFLAAYARHGGMPVDESSVAYYRLAVDYRCAITTSLAVDRGGGSRGWAPYLLQTQRYLDGIAERVATLAGLDMPAIDVAERESTTRTPMFDQLISTLRTAARAIDEAEISTATRNDQILLHYLRAHDQIGLQLEASELADRRAVCGAELYGAALVELAVKAGESTDLDVLAYLLRRQRRRRQLWSTLLDR